MVACGRRFPAVACRPARACARGRAGSAGRLRWVQGDGRAKLTAGGARRACVRRRSRLPSGLRAHARGRAACPADSGGQEDGRTSGLLGGGAHTAYPRCLCAGAPAGKNALCGQRRPLVATPWRRGPVPRPNDGRRSMEIWPGKPYPLGATYDGSGVNFAVFSEVAERVELCLLDDDLAETRLDLPGDRRLRVARLRALRAARAALRLPGPRALRPRTNGHRCNPSKLLLDPYAKAIEGQAENDQSLYSYTFGDQEAATTTEINTRRQRAAHDALGRHQPVLRLGRRPAAASRVPRDRHLRGPRQGPHDAATRRSPRRSAAPTPASRHPAMIEHLQRARHHGHRAHAGAPVRPGRAARRPRPVELLGLQHDRLLRPAQRVRGRWAARAAGARVQGDGQGAARGRHRGHPRRRLQPHRRGQPHGPDALLPRASTTPATTGWSSDDRRTTTTRPAPATASSCAARTCCS